MVDEQLADRVVKYLSDLLEKDQAAIGSLIDTRIPCNKELAEHPTCQTRKQNSGFRVGMLGVLNGLCGIYEGGPKDGYGPVAAIFDEPEEGYNSLVGFTRVKNVEDGVSKD